MKEYLKDFRPPKIGLRMVKTLLSVLIVCVAYDIGMPDRNPCFACIGAVYGMGSVLAEGAKNGLNRFIGTALGGLVVLPFYPLFWDPPFHIPGYIFLLIGLLLVIYINVFFGAHGAVQPATVVYFVVMFTQISENYASYTVARIIDTGIGVAVSLLISHFWRSPHEKEYPNSPIAKALSPKADSAAESDASQGKK